MEKLLPLLLLFVACSKSNDKPATPTTPKITVLSATVANGYMDVKVNIVKSVYYNKVNLVIYKTDITGTNYKYPLVIKDGTQDVLCPKYSDASPMSYQIQVFDASGTANFSDMMQLAY